MKDWIKNPFIITLVLAVIVTIAAIYGTLKWLDTYTRHNEAVVIPDVKGLKLNEAAPFFENVNLRYNVIDSVFSKDVPPGSIVELIPPVGSKVKEGRIVFVTINAMTSQMATIPDVEDLSSRQAYALLKSRGFSTVEIEYVSGRYKDLAINVETRGRKLQKGERVSLSAPLVLKVSKGSDDSASSFTDDSSSVESLNDNDENWF